MAEIKHQLETPRRPNANETSAFPDDESSDYWVWKNDQMSGPYTVEQLRDLVMGEVKGTTIRQLGKILISDLARSHAMSEWVTVDRVLATTFGDNTSDYWVSRNGQMSGPYNLDTMAGWVRNGRILVSDLTKNIAMPEWNSVGQVLDQRGFSLPPHIKS